jgi:NADPH:quinone reductase-like Zn-dependent oxidoreductase
MKAVRFHEHGGPDRLRYEDAPDPVAGAGEALIRVKACALNYLDIWERRGLPGIRFPLPHISGSDVSGIVESVGAGVANIRPGDKTVIFPAITCMNCAMCFSGRDNLCAKYSPLGYMIDGGYAELLKIPVLNALPFPDSLDYAGAAAVPLVFTTAWHMLVEKAAIKAGDTVLVLGAGSGVGSAAIQIAKFFHARVIATAGSEPKLEKARALGADHGIDHAKQSIRKEVRRITERRGVDIVFEHVGSATWEDSVASLAHGGRLVTCGATTGYEGRIDLRVLFAKQITLAGSYMGPRQDLVKVLRLINEGYLRPVVHEVVPLADAARAQEMLENRAHFGKVVLAV